MKLRARLFVAILVFALATPLVACLAHRHTVGTGQNGDAGGIEKHQVSLYLFSLIPLSNIDTGSMIQGDANYVIETKMDGLSFVIQLLTAGILGARDVYVRE